MELNIDGVKTMTNSFLLEFKEGDAAICGSIDVNSFPQEAV